MARRLIIFALAASMTVLVAGVSASGEEQDIPPSTTTTTTGADSENNRNEVVQLEATPELPPEFDKVRGRVQLVAYYDDHQNPAYPEPTYQAWMRLSNMPCLARFLDPGQWTYALWVDTPSNGLVRLFNFSSSCSLETAAQEAVGGSADAALNTMLHETVRFRVTVENVEGGTEFPDGVVLLTGGVDRGDTAP